jgi:hypothetical protein
MSKSLFRVPSNVTTALVQALVGSLVSHDVRYHLSWSYGDFIDHIPQRIGTSKALDSAVTALLTLHADVAVARVASSGPSIDSITKYTNAITTIRTTLDDPLSAAKTETLCAVSLLMICQAFVGASNGCRVSHGEGAAQILKARKAGRASQAEEGFEQQLLLMLRGPVLFEAIVNPKIAFTPKEWTNLIEGPMMKASPGNGIVDCMVHAPDLIQRGTIARLEQSDLTPLILETSHQYQLLKIGLAEHYDRYETVRYLPRYSITALATKIHCHYQRVYGLWLTVILAFNCIYKALDPNNVELELDSIRFCEEVLDLGDKAMIYRPLGSSWVMISLMAAWCSSSNETTKARLEMCLRDYLTDAIGLSNNVLAKELENLLRRLSLSDFESCM